MKSSSRNEIYSLEDCARTTLGTELYRLNRAATMKIGVAQHLAGHVAQRARRDRSPHIWSVVLSCLVGVAAACSASQAPGTDAAPMPQTCSGAPLCVGAEAVHACRGHLVAEVVDDCAAKGQVCNLARCTSSVCQIAETNTNSLVGCLFYTLEADNISEDEAATTSFLVTNPGGDPAAVDLQVPIPGEAGTSAQWFSEASLQVPTGESGRLRAMNPVLAVGKRPRSALRVSSDRPVTLVEIESDDSSQSASSSGGTMILPVQSLGLDYRAVTYPQAATPAVAGTPGSRGGAGRVMIVGTQMGTTVHFWPFGGVTADPSGGTPQINAGDEYVIVLDDGDVFQIYSGAEQEDLTGSLVTADQPIAIFSGNISTTYGSGVTGINSPDMAHEQMPPIATWSQTYVAASLTPQSSIACTSFFGTDGASIWRVLASVDHTTITFQGPGTATLQLLPTGGVAAPLVQPLLLDEGQAASLIGLGSFTVIADHPILVTQGMDCEPSLSLAIAADGGALIKNLRFAVLPNFDQLLGIVRLQDAQVDLDGMPLPDAMFQPAGGGFEVAEVSLPPCLPAQDVCTHHLTSSVGFGMTLRGMDVASSYALTAPALVGCDPVYEFCLN
jgi:IgGFc binding protein